MTLLEDRLQEAVDARKAAGDSRTFARALAREQVLRGRIEEIYRYTEEEHPRGRGGKWVDVLGKLKGKASRVDPGIAAMAVAGGPVMGIWAKAGADQVKRETEQDRIEAEKVTAERIARARADPEFLAREREMDARMDRALGKRASVPVDPPIERPQTPVERVKRKRRNRLTEDEEAQGMTLLQDRLNEAVTARKAATDSRSFVRAYARESVLRRHLEEREFSTKKRESLVKDKKAMPGGRYPIENGGDLENAIQAYGRGSPSDLPAIKAHIIAQARKLKLVSKLPPDWNVSS